MTDLCESEHVSVFSVLFRVHCYGWLLEYIIGPQLSKGVCIELKILNSFGFFLKFPVIQLMISNVFLKSCVIECGIYLNLNHVKSLFSIDNL